MCAASTINFVAFNTEFNTEETMKLFKKVAVNIHSQVEAIADRFENKEALSAAYIREYERAVAKTKVRCDQVDSEILRLEKEAAHLRQQVDLWGERARQVHMVDESKALACVAQMMQAQASLRQVNDNREEVKILKKKMVQELATIQHKLEALKRKHQNLASRQVCAEAVNVLQDADSGVRHDIDDLFSRWETDVVTKEIHSQSSVPVNEGLAAEFEAAEENQKLRMALEQLIAVPLSKEEEK